MPAYKDEKRGTWYVRFRYTDWTGKRVETTKRGFATKRDAKEYEEAAKREKAAAAGMTFGELYKIYIEEVLYFNTPCQRVYLLVFYKRFYLILYFIFWQ